MNFLQFLNWAIARHAFIVLFALFAFSANCLDAVTFDPSEDSAGYVIHGSFDEIMSVGLPVPVFTIEKITGSSRIGKEDEFVGVVGLGEPWDDLTFDCSRDQLFERWVSSDERTEFVVVWVGRENRKKGGYSLFSKNERATYTSHSLRSMYVGQVPVILALDLERNEVIPIESKVSEKHTLVRAIYEDNVGFLSQIDADQIRESIHGYSLLHWSASYGANECLKYLLSKGDNPDQRAPNNVTPLHLASIVGNDDCIESLIQGGATIHKTEKANRRSPLYYAAKYGHIDAVGAMIKSDVNVQKFKNENTNPLYAAFNGYHHGIVLKLIENGGRLNFSRANKEEFLLNLVSQDAVELVELMLQEKVDLNKSVRGTYPTVVAALEGSPQTLELLIENGATVDFQDSRGRTALVASIIADRKDNFDFLLNAGADMDVLTVSGESALSLAIALKRNDMVDQLIQKGADLDVHSEKSVPLIYRATYSNNPEALHKLIEAGAPCVVEQAESTVLMDYAFRYDISEIVDFAFTQCLDEDFLFYGHFSPCWVAKYYDSKGVALLLTDKGFCDQEDFDSEIVTGGAVKGKAKAVSISYPVYPLDLQDLFGEFRVMVQVIIDKNGSVIFPKIIENKVPQMDRLILESLVKWKFEPILIDSKAVRTKLRFPLEFKLVPEEERAHVDTEVDVMPKRVKVVPPMFPSSLIRKGVRGRVDLEILIDEKGKVTVEKVKGYTHAQMANACIEAVNQWVFKPAYRNGKPVKARFTQSIPYDYSR